MEMARLRVARMSWRNARGRGRAGGRELPSREALAEIVHAVCGALFHAAGPVDLREESEDFYVGHTLDSALNALLAQVKPELNYQVRHEARAVGSAPAGGGIVQDFAAALPGLRGLLDDDVMAAFHGDPAARAAWTKCCCATPASWPCCITAWPISYIRRARRCWRG